MARRFAKFTEEEIKTAFFYLSDLVNSKTRRAVDIYLDASCLAIYPPLFTSPSGDCCIILIFEVLISCNLI